MSSSSSSAEEENPHKCIKRVDKSIHYKNKLKKRIKHAKHEAKGLRFEIDQFKVKAEKLTQEAQIRYDNLKKTVTAKEEALDNLKKLSASVTAEHSYTSSQLDSRSKEWTEATTSVTKLEVEIANLTAELRKVKAEEHDAEAHEKYLQDLADREAAEIASLQALQAKENAETDAFNQKANEEKAKIHEVDDQLKKADAELDDLNRQIKGKEVEIEHLGGHVEEIVRKKIPPTHSDLQAHQNLVGGKQVQVEKVTTDLGVLLVRIPVETGERADLLKIYDTHTMTLSQLKERVATLEHDIADLTHTKQALQISYTQITEAHKTEQEHLEAANAAYSEISSKVKNARKENDVIFNEVNELKQKIKALGAEEAKTEEAEAELAAREAAEAAQLAALRVKEKEEREAIILLKKSIIEAQHTLQEHETHITGHKQTLGKVTVDLTGLHENISARDTEITGVVTEHDNTMNLYKEVTRNIDLGSKRLTDLEFNEAKLAHLQEGLDDKIKELAHKESTEHIELEKNSAHLGVLAVELDHLRAEIAKANSNLASKQKEHEGKVSAAEIDIKVHESELSHRAEVHKRKEKEVAAVKVKADLHKNHDKRKKHDKKKKAKPHHHQKKHKKASSSSESTWSSSSSSD